MRKIVVFLAITALLAAAAVPALTTTGQQLCQVQDQSTEEVLPGVVLAWDSAFLCSDIPGEGEYEISVTVANDAGSNEAVVIEALALTHTTPRPRGQAPQATAGATGLPVTLNPGESMSFTVSGAYELAQTDEGQKANLHLQAGGHVVDSGDPFQLGINVHLRGAGVTEPEDGEGGPPPWVPGS